ncbi:MAG: endonuclease/exonuclease/phosphatase family protein [Paracoccaceae bacterium]
MRIATWNVEWFVNLFDARGRLLEDDAWSSRYKVTRRDQLRAIAAVMAAVDADAMMVIEAPDDNRHRRTVPILESFARRFGLRTGRAVIGFANDTQQEIALMYDPARVMAAHDPKGGPLPAPGQSPRFDGTMPIDLDTDGNPEAVRFNKPPLEVALTTADGRALRLIGVHVKSKAPHGAHDEAHAVRLAIQNRRKQLAECLWLRARVEEHLGAGDDLLVMGDFNDGPGLDEYEALFGRSGLDIAAGTDAPPPMRLTDPHAKVLRGAGTTTAQPASARFYLDGPGQYFSAMLDFILISPGLMQHAPAWRIWHPFDDPAIYRDPGLREALLTASDHFPVTLDLKFPATPPAAQG